MGLYNIVSQASLQNGQPEDVSVVLSNLQAIQAILNGGIDNSNINAAAAILASKLSGYPADATKALLGDGTWGSAGITVATTVAGLGAGSAGKRGLLRLGASPYEFVPVTYDSTYGKWVSDVCETDIIGAFPLRNSLNDAFFSQVVGSGSAFVFGSLTQPGFALRAAAGLSLQIRIEAIHQVSNATGTLQYILRTWHASNTGASTSTGAGDGVEFSPPAFTGNLINTNIAWLGYDSSWQAVAMPGSPKDILSVAAEFINGTGVSQTMAWKNLKLAVRWVA